MIKYIITGTICFLLGLSLRKNCETIIENGYELNLNQKKAYDNYFKIYKKEYLLNDDEYKKQLDEAKDAVNKKIDIYKNKSKKVYIYKDNFNYKDIINEELAILNIKNNENIIVSINEGSDFIDKDYSIDYVNKTIYINVYKIKNIFKGLKNEEKTIYILNIFKKAYDEIINPLYKSNNQVIEMYSKYIRENYLMEEKEVFDERYNMTIRKYSRILKILDEIDFVAYSELHELSDESLKQKLIQILNIRSKILQNNIEDIKEKAINSAICE